MCQISSRYDVNETALGFLKTVTPTRRRKRRRRRKTTTKTTTTRWV